MTMRFNILIVLATIFSTGLGRTIPCLEGCTCDTSEHDPVIRCDGLGLTKFPLPHSAPLKTYHYLALTCNDLETLPSTRMIRASFPDLQGIDLQGNPRLNCSEVLYLQNEMPVLSDCESKEEQLKCDNYDKDCDWKCRTLTKLKQMWTQFKSLVSKKVKEWGAEETVEATKNWFAKQFRKFNIAIGNV